MCGGRVWLKDGTFMQMVYGRREEDQFADMLEDKLGREVSDLFLTLIANVKFNSYEEGYADALDGCEEEDY